MLLLMGPSGSGKTTLLSIMGCILRSSSGSVQIAGAEITHLKERDLPQVRLRHVGFVFQAFNLLPTLTAEENVEVTLELKGVRGAPAHKQARELLAQVHLADKCSAYPADLSGGQSSAWLWLARSPAVRRFCWPTSRLPPLIRTGRAVLELLCELAHEQNRAVVIVTHDSRVVDLGDRLVHLEDGRISS